MDLIIKSF
jgi:hypothetical protein